MKQPIIAVIGGTGKAGRYLVKQLLARGFSFKLLLRHPEEFTLQSPFMEVIKGDVREVDAVRVLVKGCHAVISTLGQTKGETTPIYTQATTNVLKAMQEYGVRRYILVTGLSLDTPEDRKSESTQQKTDWMKANFPTFIANRQQEYEMLTESDVDWTFVRLPFIEQTDERHTVKVDLYDCPGDKISATDIADFLIRQISDTAFWKKAPFIANG